MKQNRQEYFKKNAEWLEAKSKEDGVNALEKEFSTRSFSQALSRGGGRG